MDKSLNAGLRSHILSSREMNKKLRFSSFIVVILKLVRWTWILPFWRTEVSRALVANSFLLLASIYAKQPCRIEICICSLKCSLSLISWYVSDKTCIGHDLHISVFVSIPKPKRKQRNVYRAELVRRIGPARFTIQWIENRFKIPISSESWIGDSLLEVNRFNFQ